MTRGIQFEFASGSMVCQHLYSRRFIWQASLVTNMTSVSVKVISVNQRVQYSPLVYCVFRTIFMAAPLTNRWHFINTSNCNTITFRTNLWNNLISRKVTKSLTEIELMSEMSYGCGSRLIEDWGIGDTPLMIIQVACVVKLGGTAWAELHCKQDANVLHKQIVFY